MVRGIRGSLPVGSGLVWGAGGKLRRAGLGWPVGEGDLPCLLREAYWEAAGVWGKPPFVIRGVSLIASSV